MRILKVTEGLSLEEYLAIHQKYLDAYFAG